MDVALDIAQVVELSGDVDEAIKDYLEGSDDTVLDFQIYENGRDERCVAVAFHFGDLVEGGILLVTPHARSGEDMYSMSVIHENEGPFANFCPQRILDLLSPTDSQDALDWRERCRERLLIEMGETAPPSPLPEAKADYTARFTPKGFPMPKDDGLDGMDDFNRGHDWKNEQRLKGVVEEPSGPRF